MSGTLINTYSQLDSDILAVQLTLDASRIGYHAVSLTNYDSTSESAIAAGSQIEVGGALYKFESEESITGSPSDGTVYIMIVPSGTTCTAEYTNTVPAWSDSKQGYYGTGASANYRYLEFALTKTGSTWEKDVLSRDKSRVSAYVASDQTITTCSSGGFLVNFDTVVCDYLNEFDTGSNSFTAASAGLFNIIIKIYEKSDTGSVSGAPYYFRLHIHKNGSTVRTYKIGRNAADVWSGTYYFNAFDVSTILKLSKDDVITIYYEPHWAGTISPGTIIYGGSILNEFSIYKI